MVILIMSFLLPTLVSGSSEKMINIYYIPIGAETYVPITVENIEANYVRYGNFKINNPNLKKLFDLIRDTESEVGTFDGEIVRVKIIFPDEKILYIDNNGGVKSHPSEKIGNVRKNLKKIRSILETIL